MHIRFDKSGSPPSQDRSVPGSDALTEFRLEVRSPIKPAIVRAAPRTRETRRGYLAPVPRAVSVSTPRRRIEVPSFLLGAMCGALCGVLSLIAVYWLAG
jgi:hypothetical protein